MKTDTTVHLDKTKRLDYLVDNSHAFGIPPYLAITCDGGELNIYAEARHAAMFREFADALDGGQPPDILDVAYDRLTPDLLDGSVGIRSIPDPALGTGAMLDTTIDRIKQRIDHGGPAREDFENGHPGADANGCPADAEPNEGA